MFRPALIVIAILGGAMPALAQDKDTRLPENTIDCSQFKKTGPQEWIEVGSAVFDLGKIPDIHLTEQPVRPRSFRFGGVDLYPVLEGKCGAPGYLTQGKADQAKGNADSALANFDRAISIDPKYAEAYDNRGSVYAGKGDYTRAIADYDEALRLDPKLESAANHKAAAKDKIGQQPVPDAPAESQTKAEEMGAALKKGLESASAAVQVPEQNQVPEQKQIPEQKDSEQSMLASESKGVSLKSEPESGCQGKKLIYAADGVAGAEGVKPVIEIVLANKPADAKSGGDSGFIIRESRNNQIQWAHTGKTIQRNKTEYLEFLLQQSRRRKAVALTLNYIKPNREGNGEAILHLGGLHALFASEDNVRALKFEGKRPTEPLPETFYFDRCE